MGPDGFGALVDLALGAKDQESGESASKPTVVSNCDDCALVIR